jgi:Holliday junction resolvase
MYTNYHKGRNKEYRICKALRKKGYDIVQRSAGSHSPIDILAIRREDNRISLIQSKPNGMSDNSRDKLEKKHSWLNGKFDIEFVVV